ncbi:uncharacterized protein NECHADRAFT_29772 [Fusarium vanettenii 77-13-4]|uniref:Protamine P1 n=1 Tax=Fusarium vanettenii (strain ATCC MYA-4622 / CBS 123669 / FGSC 9596 / NRRL 45880 / 77-13-4) TaxID=660122 RepID=C7YVY0_FUSV7|nr:uncharacterized protein NECHADRAFT_29772 [Fusarium vanettenii 77-13-4]EEU43866.1 hypothetical protein NECHADRAFT_29772 [Fusarium vanettenii 77-13-4]
MQRVDPSADELSLEWGEDTIYCEATCAPEDVLYEGSDDEDYDNPISRKLRYEEAGQRYLDGKTPFLITASLKGPFDSKSGRWVNPWRSKHRTSGTSQGVRTSPGKLLRSAQVKRNVSIPETILTVPGDSLECHLPSPESLKQSSVAGGHAYLEEDELAKVQEWREAIEPGDVTRDRFWTSTPQSSLSARKRKAKGSSWLKHLATKRRRTDNTPVPQRSHPITIVDDQDDYGDAPTISFNSVPDRLPSSALAANRFFALSQANEEAKHAEDELSRDNTASMQAAATLSSPISQRQHMPATGQSTNCSQHSVQRQSQIKPASPSQQPSQNYDAESYLSLSSSEDDKSSSPSPAFETQEDQSFCFKMRPKHIALTEIVETSSLVPTSVSAGDLQTSVSEEESWSGLSSVDEASGVLAQDDDTPRGKPNTEGLDINMADAPVTGPMDLDKPGMSSDLSSISSQEFTGFDLSEETPDDPCEVDTASDSSETGSDTAIMSSPTPEEEMVKIVDTESSSGSEEPDAEPQREAIYVAVVDDNSGRVKETTDSEDETTEDETGQEEGDSTNSSTASGNKSAQRKESNTPLPNTPVTTKVLSRIGSNARVPPSQKQLSSPINGDENGYQTVPSPNPGPKAVELEQTPSSIMPPIGIHVIEATTPQLEVQQTPPRAHDAMDVDQQDPKGDLPVPFSQQSPWAESKLSQYASMAMDRLPTIDSAQESTPLNKTHDSLAMTSPAAQTPWTEGTTRMPMMGQTHIPTTAEEDHMAVDVPNTPEMALNANAQVQNEAPVITPAPVARPAMPEPQFSVKSFASFMSSPESRPRKVRRASWRDSGSRLPSTQGILASATKNPWERNSSQRRVSWAPLPHETEGQESIPATPTPLAVPARAASPPPTTPIEDLPTSEDAKFRKHFNAVARRSSMAHGNAFYQRLLPSESQRTVGSPEPDAMAETFVTADQLRQKQQQQNSNQHHLADHTKSDRETDESQDPLDMVEDVFREMGDFLEKWDVDNTKTPQPAQGPQSPW